MKKVVLTVTNDLRYDERMHRICRSLSNAGYLVSLAGRKRPWSIPLQSELYRQYRLSGIFEKGWLFYAEYNFRLFFFLLFKKFDYIVSADLDSLLAGNITARLKGKPNIFDAHEFFTEVPELKGRKWVKNIWERIARFSLPHTTIRYTVSGSLAQALETKYQKNFHVIRNVPCLEELPSKNEKEPVILYRGALNKGRGLEELLHALPRLPVQAWLAGDGDLSDRLRQLAKKLNVEGQVRFLGRKTPEEMKALTSQAYLGYNLLDPGSKSYYYSLSNKFFHYIHNGIPSLSNPFPEYQKINRQFRVSYLTPLSVENIVTGVNLLYKNHSFYTNMVRNCLKARENFNWQEEEKKLLKLYKEI